jgi:hypothetical protein
MLNGVLNLIFPYEHIEDPFIMESLKEKWEKEVDFTDMFIGKCHLVVYRNPELGCLNGYVGVKRSHPYFKKDRSHYRIRQLRCHGGITFTGERKGFDPYFKKGYWYIGFDTAHGGDYIPRFFEDKKLMELMKNEPVFKEMNNMMKALYKDKTVVPMPTTKRNYKDIDFLSKEVSGLYHQLTEIMSCFPKYKHSLMKEYHKHHRFNTNSTKRDRKRGRKFSNPSQKLKKGTFMRVDQLLDDKEKVTYLVIDIEVSLGAVVKLFTGLNSGILTKIGFIPQQGENYKKERLMAYQNPLSTMIMEGRNK